MRCFLDVLHLIYKDEVSWVSQCVGEFDHSVHFCDGFILAITVHIALYLFDLLCLSALFLSRRPHHIPVCSMSAKYLCLSYNLSTVYSICTTTALKLKSALGTQRGGPITAQATEAGF